MTQEKLKSLIQYSKDMVLLYVEDDNIIASGTLALLENFFDTIHYATNGLEGLNKYNENHIDLIITDIRMPQMNGLEMLEAIKKIDPDYFAIITSAHGEKEYYHDAVNLQIQGYLLKPVVMNKLFSLIREIIEKKQQKDIQSNKIQHLAQSNKKLIDIGYKLTNEKDYDKLLESILNSAMELTNSDGGTLYLLNHQTKELSFEIVYNKTLNIFHGGSKSVLNWKNLKLFDIHNNPNRSNVAAICALEDKLINIIDIYNSTTYDFSGAKIFDEQNNYRSKSMLVIPMKNRDDEIIGIIQLINKKNNSNETISFNADDEHLVTSMGYQSAMVLQNRKLVEDLETFLYALIRSIGSALDVKSRHTATHVFNVSKIAEYLAIAVNENQSLYKDIQLNSNQLEELKLSAWLHDIGKISTPDHIINKASKLETVYDRIESIKLKYENLKLQTELDFFKEKIDETTKNSLFRIFDNELTFLISINSGREVLDQEKKSFLEDIKKNRKIIKNGKTEDLLDDDEFKNLNIFAGTLNEQDREIINNHVIVTYDMLKDIPFPKKFANVAKIAGSHHKTLDGKGYSANEIFDHPMSIQDKILAIADVFEALSSSQRAYKEPHKLSEIAKILHSMAQDKSIDFELVKLFFNNDNYQDFISHFLDASQIDNINKSLFS